jgi:hypothetical protein
VVYFGGVFGKLEYFAGFSPHIINFAVRISEAAMAGDIIFFSLPGPVRDYTGAHAVFLRAFSIYNSPEEIRKL